MAFLIRSVWKDLSRWARDATNFVVWLGIPLLVGGLITSLVGGEDGITPSGILLVVDEDKSFVSRVLVGALSEAGIDEVVTIHQMASPVEARNLIDAGEGSALLAIPAGFGDAILHNRPTALQLRTNPSETIVPKIIEEFVEILIDAGFYLQQVAGEELAVIAEWTGQGTAPDSAAIGVVAAAISDRVQAVSSYLSPLAIEVEVAPPDEMASVPLGVLFLPGIVLMAVMFSANGLAADFWAERQQGTLRRISSAPRGVAELLAGKALASAIVITTIAGIALALGFAYHGLSWPKLLPSLVWILLSGIALFSLFAIIQMAAPTQRSAMLISSMLLFPLLMAGGSFFPLESLPDWIAVVGRFTPNGFIADRLTIEVTGPGVWSIPATDWLIVSVAAGLGLAIAAVRLSSGFARQ